MVVRVRLEFIVLPELLRIEVPLPDDMPEFLDELPEFERTVDRVDPTVPLPELTAVPRVVLRVVFRPELMPVFLSARVVALPELIAVEREVLRPLE